MQGPETLPPFHCDHLSPGVPICTSGPPSLLSYLRPISPFPESQPDRIQTRHLPVSVPQCSFSSKTGPTFTQVPQQKPRGQSSAQSPSHSYHSC